MPEPADDSDNPSIADQALAWCVRLNSGDITANDRAQFRLWLAADPEHQREFDKANRLWGDLGGVSDPRRLTRRRMLKGAAGAAAVLAIAGTMGLPDFLTSDHYTSVAERKTVNLQDGSRIELDAYTALSVDYTQTRRRIALKRGRALFTVAADPVRPFEVLSGEGTITAVGTQFIVHRIGDAMTVAVLENAVAVSIPGAQDGVVSELQLKAGRQIFYQGRGIHPLEAAVSEEETAWRLGRLVFEDQTLERVVEDINRYRRGRILVADRALSSLRISGTFDINRPDEVLDAIEKTLPVRAFWLSRYLIILRRV